MLIEQRSVNVRIISPNTDRELWDKLCTYEIGRDALKLPYHFNFTRIRSIPQINNDSNMC